MLRLVCVANAFFSTLACGATLNAHVHGHTDIGAEFPIIAGIFSLVWFVILVRSTWHDGYAAGCKVGYDQAFGDKEKP